MIWTSHRSKLSASVLESVAGRTRRSVAGFYSIPLVIRSVCVWRVRICRRGQCLANLREFVDHSLNAPLDFVTDRANCFKALSGRVVENPVSVTLAGEDRARVAAAHGDDDIRILDGVDSEDLRRLR